MTQISSRRQFTLSALGLVGFSLMSSLPSMASSSSHFGTLTGHCVQGLTHKMQLGKAAVALGVLPLPQGRLDESALKEQIHQDYQNGHTVVVNHWTLSQTQAQLFAGYATAV